MNYSKKDVIIGFVVVLLIVLGLIFFFNNRNRKTDDTSVDTPISVDYKNDFEDKFKYDIPEDQNFIELKDVNGGDFRGLATEKEILVDAADPEPGYFYQAWLEKDGLLVSLGKMVMAKGGWIIEYDLSENDEYRKVIVSKEKRLDSTIETKILEGSF